MWPCSHDRRPPRVASGVGRRHTERVTDQLTHLTAGQIVPYGGDRFTTVPAELAEAFTAGDRLVIVNDDGALLHIPAAEWEIATGAVGRAVTAFGGMGAVSDEQISAFYEAFAARLADDATFAPIAEANAADVEAARARGRSTTRLVLSDTMRTGMIDGLRMWAGAPSNRDRVTEQLDHDGWSLEGRLAGLGAVGFVFEGRPNVFADACGVLRGGNTVVFRIGSDALGTARAIVTHALDPALAEAGLPAGAASLVDSASRSAGHAMFSDPRLGLAVARGSGAAVAQLGAVARQAGVPVSLHGTGGAWIVVGASADPDHVSRVVHCSLDRKVCNTVNTVAVPRSVAATIVPAVLAGATAAAAERDVDPKVHVVGDAAEHVPADWFDTPARIGRAEGVVAEPKAEPIDGDRLGHEWEWEESPEITLVVVDDVDAAVAAYNTQAPRFVASLLSTDDAEHDHFWNTVDAPFVGNGFTRWVDGQYALDRPELGLSNWEFGRLFARGGVLSGDSVFTVRYRATQDGADLRR